MARSSKQAQRPMQREPRNKSTYLQEQTDLQQRHEECTLEKRKSCWENWLSTFSGKKLSLTIYKNQSKISQTLKYKM
jgi:hypothetical protein